MKNTFESFIGTVILIIAIIFLFQFFKINNAKISTNNITLNAIFNDIGGISVGTDVKISGVKVGYVKKTSLDNKTMQANVQILVDSNIKIPIDSFITISTNGIFGSKFISIIPGIEDENMQNYALFQNSKSSLNLEDLISKFVTK
jgi:phospholipid/cholesterol/gamma-HCH transport system substrate-binding protein